MQLKTPNGRTIDPNNIDYILMLLVQGTLVQLKTGEEVFLENSNDEVVNEIRKAAKQQELA